MTSKLGTRRQSAFSDARSASGFALVEHVFDAVVNRADPGREPNAFRNRHGQGGVEDHEVGKHARVSDHYLLVRRWHCCGAVLEYSPSESEV